MRSSSETRQSKLGDSEASILVAMKYIVFLVGFVLTVLVVPALANAQGPTMCTMQYDPVCGTKNGVHKTYGNGCVLGAEGATYQHEGECSAAELAGRQEGTYTPPAHCTTWFDGCNRCSRSPDGQSMCTLMACMGEASAGYCTAYGDTEVGTAPTPNEGAPDSEVLPAEQATSSEAATSTEKDIGFFFTFWYRVQAWFMGLF